MICEVLVLSAKSAIMLRPAEPRILPTRSVWSKTLKTLPSLKVVFASAPISTLPSVSTVPSILMMALRVVTLLSTHDVSGIRISSALLSTPAFNTMSPVLSSVSAVIPTFENPSKAAVFAVLTRLEKSISRSLRSFAPCVMSIFDARSLMPLRVLMVPAISIFLVLS